MIALFKIRRAISSIEEYLRNHQFDCKVEDANSCVFNASKVYVCVKVVTDYQKKLLLSDAELLQYSKAAFLQEGIVLASDSGWLRVESQETVNRDWNGNWFYALFK